MMGYIFGALSLLALIFCATIIIDRTIFTQRVKKIIVGKTGKEIQEETGLTVTILKVDGKKFYASVKSILGIFSYTLVFYNGTLISKNRD